MKIVKTTRQISQKTRAKKKMNNSPPLQSRCDDERPSEDVIDCLSTDSASTVSEKRKKKVNDEAAEEFIID